MVKHEIIEISSQQIVKTENTKTTNSKGDLYLIFKNFNSKIS